MHHVKVSIFGHKPEYIDDPAATKRAIERTISLLSFQYGLELVINVVGDIGVNQWVVESCKQLKVKYHLFLTCMPEDLSAAWYDEQKNSLKDSFRYAWATTIHAQEFNPKSELETYFNSITGANFVIPFWAGRKQGITYESIKHSLEKNKITLDGYKELKLITNEDLR